jgi:hypothetical protein
MLVSHSAKFIFVHVQKTAGMSFETVLKRHFPDVERWHGRHGHARDGVADIGLERWRDYYSFAFVRNPWERLVSWYAMIDEKRRELPFYKRWRSRPFKREIWNQVYQKAETFDAFIENCTEVVFDGGSYKSFAYNQLDYVCDADGGLLIDKIGRFENLAADAAEVFARIGVDDQLPKRNLSTHGHYSDWYTDRTRDIVGDRFRRDIDYFGYRFERP